LLVEGITYVSVRSALRSLSTQEIERLSFDGLEELILPAHLEEVRGQLRELVSIVLAEAERVASMFDAFRLLSDQIRSLCQEWKSARFVAPRAAALPDGKLADRVKECLRVPLLAGFRFELPTARFGRFANHSGWKIGAGRAGSIAASFLERESTATSPGKLAQALRLSRRGGGSDSR
jgi:hypothetical protein